MRIPQLLAGTCFVLAPALNAQTPPDSARTTRAGVYSEDQGTRGKDVYLGQCQSCHTAADFTNADFKAKWGGKKLAEFFTYLVESMPESEPGALSKDQYAQVTAYLLQLNGMPAGPAPLATSADSLQDITIEFEPPAGGHAAMRGSGSLALTALRPRATLVAGAPRTALRSRQHP